VHTMRVLIALLPETQETLRKMLDGEKPGPKVFVPEVRPGPLPPGMNGNTGL